MEFVNEVNSIDIFKNKCEYWFSIDFNLFAIQWL